MDGNGNKAGVGEQARSRYTETLLVVAWCAALLRKVDIPKILEDIERAHALGPVLDPTMYLAKAKLMSEDEEVLRAALPLWQLAKKIESGAKSMPAGSG